MRAIVLEGFDGPPGSYTILEIKTIDV